MNNRLTIRVFTDPACPFAYSAEPARWRLKWLYGEQIDWQTTMIVLSEKPEDHAKKGFTPEIQAKNLTRLRVRHGMPIDDTVRARMAVSVDACRTFVAIRKNQPAAAEPFLRNIRIAGMAGEMIDELGTIRKSVVSADLNPDDVSDWLTQTKVENVLRNDMRDARTPTKAALALQHKLAAMPDGGYRYSAPSYQFINDGNTRFELPGFWATAAYEAAAANVTPELTRQPDPGSAKQVLEWAKEPLATVEVAAIMGRDTEETRAALQKVAAMQPVGQDGFWSLS